MAYTEIAKCVCWRALVLFYIYVHVHHLKNNSAGLTKAVIDVSKRRGSFGTPGSGMTN